MSALQLVVWLRGPDAIVEPPPSAAHTTNVLAGKNSLAGVRKHTVAIETPVTEPA